MNIPIMNTKPEVPQAAKIVLVVDDSPDNNMVLKEVLGSAVCKNREESKEEVSR